MSLRALTTAFLLASTAPAFAEGQAIPVYVNYSLQVPATGDNDAAISDQEKSLKRSLYERSVRECAEAKATVALTCQITSINVSTQITRNAGAPAQLYVNSSVQLQITLK